MNIRTKRRPRTKAKKDFKVTYVPVGHTQEAVSRLILVLSQKGVKK
jgi:hypothetical protein